MHIHILTKACREFHNQKKKKAIKQTDIEYTVKVKMDRSKMDQKCNSSRTAFLVRHCIHRQTGIRQRWKFPRCVCTTAQVQGTKIP